LKYPFYETKDAQDLSWIGIRVAKSSIPNAGLGVYATRNLEYGQHLMKFIFKRSTLAELRNLYDFDDENGIKQEGLVPYGFKMGGIADAYGDAACIRNAPSIVNDRRNRSKANVEFTTHMVHGTPEVWLKVRDSKARNPRSPIAIKTGQELFVNYGDDYWKTASKVGHNHQLKRVPVSWTYEANHGRRGRIVKS